LIAKSHTDQTDKLSKHGHLTGEPKLAGCSRMPFLLPNQQHQSTEGLMDKFLQVTGCWPTKSVNTVKIHLHRWRNMKYFKFLSAHSSTFFC